MAVCATVTVSESETDESTVEITDDVFAGGEVIQFRINAGAVDFSAGGSPSADTLTVRITHTNSDSILVENTWVI